MDLIYLIRRIWREQPLRLGASVVALAIAGLLEGFALAAIVPLLELVQGGGSQTAPQGRLGGIIGSALATLGLPLNLATCLAFILLLVLLSQAVILAQQKVLAGSVARFEATLREDLYGAIIEADWSFFVAQKATDLTGILMNEAAKAGVAYVTLVQLLGTAIMVAVYLVLAVAISLPMTLIVGVSGALILLILRPRVARGSAYGQRMTQTSLEMSSEVYQHIAAAKTVKAYTVESQTIARLKAIVAEFAGLQYKNLMNQGWLKFFYDFISMTSVFLGMYVAVTFFGMSIAFLVVFLLVFYRISPRISNMQSLQTSVLALVPGLKAVDRLTTLARESNESSGVLPVAGFAESISLDDVSFEYCQGTPTLTDVSLDIPAGRTVAIVGPSGSGKTTIVDLLLGLIRPTVGAVRVDGRPMAELDVRQWRNRIGYVAQDSSFFHASVAENIRFGCPAATDNDVLEAARLAFADGFIEQMPDGYETIVGDRGIRLSGGQRQRLALARAIVRRPDVLILDEATSALDAESEEKIQRAVDHLAQNMTVIIVTHRLATVRNADVIHFLETGRLAESGSWDELTAHRGRFWEMQAKQSLA